MAFWRNIRLAPKLIATFLILGIVPLLVTGAISYNTAKDALDREAEGKLEEVAFQAADKVDRNLFERYGDVQAFALSEPARSMEPARISAWMDEMAKTYAPIYKLMIVADKQGRIVAVNTTGHDGKAYKGTSKLLGKDVSGTTWFKETISGKMQPGQSHVEDLHRDPLVAEVYGAGGINDLALSFSAPIRDNSGAVVGVWSNRFNWEVVVELLRRMEERAGEKGGKSVALALVNPEGAELVDTHPDHILIQNVKDNLGVSQVPDLQPGKSMIESAKNGLDESNNKAIVAWSRHAGYQNFVAFNWTAVATQRQDEAVSAATDLRTRSLIFALGAAVVIAAGAFFFAQTVTKPIRQLRDAADKLSVGEAEDVDITIEGNDEIAELAQSFKRMTVSLKFMMQRQRAQQREHAAGSEDRVA